MSTWAGEEELGERILAIEAVSHVHLHTPVVEHLLADLVRFLESGRVDRSAA